MHIHNFWAQLARTGPEATINDPGDAGAIPVIRSGVCMLTTASAETRTLAIPTHVGQVLMLVFTVDVGDCVVTVASGINQTGNTIITFDNAGEYLLLVAAKVAGLFVWRAISTNPESESPALS